MAVVMRALWPGAPLAAFLVVFSLGGTEPAAASQDLPAPTAGTYALVAVASASIAVYRLRPWWTFVVAGSALVAYLALGYAFGPILFAGMVAVYGLTSRVTIRTAIWAAAGLLALVLLAIAVRVETATEPDYADYVTTPAWILIPAAIGIAVRVRRESTREVREAESRTAVSEERLRMAQEIHDTVGHGLAVIAMQAGVALHVLERDPVKARESLEAIRGASRHALDDVRAELDVLRGAVDADAAHRPAVGLADVPALAARMRSTGLPVLLEMDDDADDDLPGDVDFAAYRIVQESLTNVLRHAGTDASAQVHVSRTADSLAIEVRDDGVGAVAASQSSSGHGIPGMRQRAEALGGTVSAGALAGGGFAVTAQFPVRRRAQNFGV